MFVTLPLLLAGAASADPTEVTLGKLSLAPEAYDGQIVQVDVAMAMVVAQKVLSHCKGKEKAIQVMPPLVTQPGSSVPAMGAMGTVMYQVCLPVEAALELADLSTGRPLRVTGEVDFKRSVGILIAVVFRDARVEVLDGPAADGLAAPTAPSEAPSPAGPAPAEPAPAAEPAPPQ